MSDAERFRREAENCLRLTAKAVNQTDKEALLWMAEEWLRLAHAAEYLAKPPQC